MLTWLEASKGWYGTKTYLIHLCLFHLFRQHPKKSIWQTTEKHHHWDLKKATCNGSSIWIGNIWWRNQQKTRPFKHHKQKIKEVEKDTNQTPHQQPKLIILFQQKQHYQPKPVAIQYIYIYIYIPGSLKQHVSIFIPSGWPLVALQLVSPRGYCTALNLELGPRSEPTTQLTLGKMPSPNRFWGPPLAGKCRFHELLQSSRQLLTTLFIQ